MTTSYINLGNFDQFKTVMSAITDKLNNFSLPELSVLEAQISNENKELIKIKSIQSDIQNKQTVAQALMQQQKYSADSSEYKAQDNIIKITLDIINAGATNKITKQSFLGDKTPDLLYQEWTEKFQEANNNVIHQQVLINELEQKKQKTNKEWQAKKPAFDKLISDTRTLINNLGTTPSEQQQTALYDALNKITAAVPDPFYGKVLQGLYVNASAQLYDESAKKIREQLKNQLKEKLGDPPVAGNKEAMKLKFDLGVGLGKVLNVGAELSSEFSYDVTVGDNGKITLKKANTTSITPKASLDIKVFKGEESVKGSLAVSQAYEFNTLDDFIDAETNRIGTAFLEYSTQTNPSPVKTIKDYFITSKAVNLRERAVKQKAELTKNAKLLGMMTSDQNLDAPLSQEIDYVKTNNITVSGNAGGKIEFKGGIFTGTISGSVEIQHSKDTKIHHVQLLDNYKQHSVLQNIAENTKSNYFGFSMGAQQYNDKKAIEQIKSLEQQIKSIHAEATGTSLSDEQKTKLKISRESVREGLKGTLDDLRIEYEALAYLNNRIQASDDVGGVKTTRDKILKSRGSANSAEYVKAVSLQYSSLRRLYNATFTNEEENDFTSQVETADFASFEEALTFPNFYISQSDAEKYLKVQQRSKAEKDLFKVTGSVEVKGAGSLAAVSGKAEVKYTAELDEKFKPKIEYASISGEISASTDIKKLIGQFIDSSKAMDSLKSIDTTDISNELNNALIKNTFSLTPGYKGKLEINIAKNKDKWVIKNIRVSDEKSFKIGDKADIPTGSGVNVKLGGELSTQHSRTHFEYVGDNTLFYLNDLYAAQNPVGQPSNWNTYKNKNLDYYDRLFKNLKNTNSVASKELDDWLKDMSDTDTVKTEFVEVLEGFRNGTKVHADVARKFDALLESRLIKARKEQFKKYVFNVKSENLREYAAQLIADGIKDYVNEYQNKGISSTDAKDVTSILNWAKKYYKTNPKASDGMDIIKKAYALDYVQQTLNDAIEGDDKGKGTAIKLLDGNYIADVYADPKVYVSQGVSGTLRADVLDKGTDHEKTKIYIDVLGSKGASVPYDLDKKIHAKMEGIGSSSTNDPLYYSVGKKEQEADDGSIRKLVASSTGIATRGDSKKNKKLAMQVAKVISALDKKKQKPLKQKQII